VSEQLQSKRAGFCESASSAANSRASTRVSDWLSAIYREIEYEHWRTGYRQLDETPIDYLQPGSGKAQTGYLCVSNMPGGTVLFHWHGGRDAAGVTKLSGTPCAPFRSMRFTQSPSATP